MPKYTYSNFLWSFGTTSFRQRNLPLKLEIGCRALQNMRLKYPKEKWNTLLYPKYLEELNQFEIINYGGTLPDKDARAISSFLQQLGLCNDDRYLTQVGRKILGLSETPTVTNNNEFNVSKYAYIYFLQLLKKSYSIGHNASINPFIMIIICILENGYISDAEFKFFIMTTIDNGDIEKTLQTIKEYRESENKEEFIFEYITKLLFSMENYQKIYEDFVINDSVADNDIRELGINRKGGKYEIPQERLYLLLKKCNQKKLKPTLKQVEEIINSASSGRRKYLRKLLLGESRKRKDMQDYLNNELKTIEAMTPKKFREWYLYQWHFIKTCQTTDDYLDLNKRVLSMTELFSITSNLRLKLFPYAFFKSKEEKLLDCAIMSKSIDNYSYYTLSEIFDGVLVSDPQEVYQQLSKDLGQQIDESNVNSILQKIDNDRFKEVIDEKFSKEIVIKILSYIREQYSTNDYKKMKKQEEEIQRLVSKDANTPTIFEYITAIAWYYISEREILPLEAMNLSLDGDYLPKTHASGGQSDLVFKYRDYKKLPNHDFILEVTLNKDSNQRRAEMEPVSRHLGEYKVKHPKRWVYCGFLAHNLDKNTIIHFRQQKITPYYYQGEWAEDNMIIPMEIDNIIYSLKNDITYSKMFSLFKQAYKSTTPIKEWWEKEINLKLI